jgi:3-deoxy-D-manno-octulosonic acid kinase
MLPDEGGTMTDPYIQSDSAGTIVFDADLAPQVGHDWFVPEAWAKAGCLRSRGGGRGAVSFVDTPAGACVLRHFHRGGMVATILGDRYLWSGREKTRSFAEFRLLSSMRKAGLPVPQPVAARYVRSGLYYTADLMTRRIDHACTLAQSLEQGHLDSTLARNTGMLIARFHRHGIWHADLNAHNILVTRNTLYIIDFDRGEMRAPAASWQQANLQRLRRSLVKLGAAADGETRFEHRIWSPLLQGYESPSEKELRE